MLNQLYYARNEDLKLFWKLSKAIQLKYFLVTEHNQTDSDSRTSWKMFSGIHSNFENIKIKS